jgi:S-adenosylmethionine-dependent carboxyl methyltransferase
VFPCAVGRSFYEQILPLSSVTLGWSSWAVQWLSRVPALIPDQVQVAYSRDAAARAAFSKQAAEDSQCFLTHRGAELRSGRRLVVLSMALDEYGDFGYRAAVAAIYCSLLDLLAGFSQSGRSAEHGNPDIRSESLGFHGAIRGEREFRWSLARRD